ncbi:MAG TPA: SseB family protein [Verrucomicrobiae bacterium]|nr:SseB family protein [Verrucomicrobiae bacterium]
MNEELLRTLRGLPKDPTLAVILYKQLFEGRYWALVQKPGGDLARMLFLTYPTRDGLRELPVFTAQDRRLLSKFSTEEPGAMTAELEGRSMWPRMLDIVKTRECEVAVDPTEQYGIRLTREMILAMISMYGTAKPSA